MSYAAALRTAVRRRSEAGPARLILPALFLLLALPMLVFSALIVPSAEVPDEVAHIVRANSLLHGVLIGHRVPVTDALGQPAQDAVVAANPALIAAGFAFPPGTIKLLGRERLNQLRAVPWSPTLAPATVPNTAAYMPLFYVPAALALGIAHAAGLGPYDAILAARLCNGLVFAAIGALALLLTRRAQGILFATLTLPMTLSLAASCNQDGLLIAGMCLIAALFTRPFMGTWAIGTVLLALVIATKPLYLPLAGIAALALPAPRLSIGLRAAGLAFASVPALLWYALAQHTALVPFLQPAPYAAGPLWPGDPGQRFAAWDTGLQLRVIRHDPAVALRLPLKLLRDGYDLLAMGVVGVLGTLDVLLPPWLYRVWYWALACAALASVLGRRGDPAGPSLPVSVLGLICVLAAGFAVILGSYLSFTPIGADEVRGVQGRYALLLLPMVGWALPTLRFRGGGTLRAVLVVPCVAAAVAGLIVIPSLLVATYYLR